MILLRVARRDFRTEACFFVAWKRTSGSIVVLAHLESESGNAPITDGTTLRFCTEEAGANDVAQGRAFALVSPAGVARQSFTARQEARDDTVVRQIKAHRVTTQNLDLRTRLLVTAVEPDASAILLHDAAGSLSKRKKKESKDERDPRERELQECLNMITAKKKAGSSATHFPVRNVMPKAIAGKTRRFAMRVVADDVGSDHPSDSDEARRLGKDGSGKEPGRARKRAKRVSALAPEASGSAPPASEPTSSMRFDRVGHCGLDLAPTGRSTCKRCLNKIAKDTFRWQFRPVRSAGFYHSFLHPHCVQHCGDRELVSPSLTYLRRELVACTDGQAIEQINTAIGVLAGLVHAPGPGAGPSSSTS